MQRGRRQEERRTAAPPTAAGSIDMLQVRLSAYILSCTIKVLDRAATLRKAHRRHEPSCRPRQMPQGLPSTVRRAIEDPIALVRRERRWLSELHAGRATLKAPVTAQASCSLLCVPYCVQKFAGQPGALLYCSTQVCHKQEPTDLGLLGTPGSCLEREGSTSWRRGLSTPQIAAEVRRRHRCRCRSRCHLALLITAVWATLAVQAWQQACEQHEGAGID